MKSLEERGHEAWRKYLHLRYLQSSQEVGGWIRKSPHLSRMVLEVGFAGGVELSDLHTFAVRDYSWNPRAVWCSKVDGSAEVSNLSNSKGQV